MNLSHLHFGFIFSFILVFTMNAQQHVNLKKKTTPTYLNNTEKNTVNLYKRVLPSVVTIFTESEELGAKGSSKASGLGSGVLVSHDCYILTAAHVVDGSEKIFVKTQDGKRREANILFSEKTADIALLQLKVLDPNLAHAVLGDSNNLTIGQSVFAIGSPYGLENSFSAGIISGFRGYNSLYDGTVNVEFLQTDASINSGNSGGPIFNSKGEVIGIASSILTVSGGFQGIGMVVSINTAKDLLAFENRPWIGIDGVFLTPEELANLFNLDLAGGLLIQNIAAESPADKAGLRAGYIPIEILGRKMLLGGDIILKLGPQEVCHEACLEHSKESLKNHKSLKIEYLRGGKIYTTNIDVSATRKNYLVKG